MLPFVIYHHMGTRALYKRIHRKVDLRLYKKNTIIGNLLFKTGRIWIFAKPKNTI